MVKGGRKTEKEEVAFAVEVFELDTWWNARIRANIVDIYINRREMVAVSTARGNISDRVGDDVESAPSR